MLGEVELRDELQKSAFASTTGVPARAQTDPALSLNPVTSPEVFGPTNPGSPEMLAE